MDKHQLHSAIIQLTNELGRPPTKLELCEAFASARSALRYYYKDRYNDLKNAVGLETPNISTEKIIKLEKQYKSICSKKEQIQGFFRHVIDLDDLFKRAGNPAVLKLSGMPDTHEKYKCIPSFNCYLKFLKYYNPDIHLIFGDFADCEGLSHWPASDLEPRRIIPEMKQGRLSLEKIVEHTPNCNTRIFLKGNHEDWIEQALNKMPELFDGLADLGLEINIEKLLNLKGYGYELFPLNHLVQIGKANFTHGLFTGTNHAKKHLDTFKCNIFYGHLHDSQSHCQTSIDGPMVAQSCGCLARLDAKFLKGRPNNWVNGFLNMEIFDDGNFTYSFQNIINGKMAYNGIIFDGNI